MNKAVTCQWTLVTRKSKAKAIKVGIRSWDLGKGKSKAKTNRKVR